LDRKDERHDTLSGSITDRKRRSSKWNLTLLGVGIAVSLLGDSTLYTVLPDPVIALQVGVSTAAVGILLGINRLVRLISNVSAGALYDRIPRRRILIVSIYLGACSTLIFAFGQGFTPLLLSRILWGLAWSGLWIGGNTAMLDLAQSESRARSSGGFQMWFFIGAGGTALLGGFLTDAIGFRQALFLSGGLTVLMAFLWHAALPDIRSMSAPINQAGVEQGSSTFPWRESLPAAVPVFVIRFIFAGVMAATTILWLKGYIGREATIGALTLPLATLTGAIVAVRMLISVFGAPLTGLLSDITRRRWSVLGGAALLGAIGAWMMGSAGLAWALTGAAMAAITSSGIQALTPVIAGERVTASQYGRSLSVLYTFGDLGSALGPPIALSLTQWISVGSLYRGCGILLLFLTVFSIFQKDTAAQEVVHA
jgi:MFS family permease